MTEREALRLALEALEDLGMKHFDNTGEVLYKDTFTAIKEALAQPEHGWTPERIAGMARLKDAQDKRLAQPSVSVEQEPFAFLHPQKGFYFAKPTKILAPTIVDVEPLALYTTPSLHKPLSDEKLKKIWYDMENIMGWYSFQEIARAIEAAHGIKENT